MPGFTLAPWCNAADAARIIPCCIVQRRTVESEEQVASNSALCGFQLHATTSAVCPFNCNLACLVAGGAEVDAAVEGAVLAAEEVGPLVLVEAPVVAAAAVEVLPSAFDCTDAEDVEEGASLGSRDLGGGLGEDLAMGLEGASSGDWREGERPMISTSIAGEVGRAGIVMGGT